MTATTCGTCGAPVTQTVETNTYGDIATTVLGCRYAPPALNLAERAVVEAVVLASTISYHEHRLRYWSAQDRLKAATDALLAAREASEKEAKP